MNLHATESNEFLAPGRSRDLVRFIKSEVHQKCRDRVASADSELAASLRDAEEVLTRSLSRSASELESDTAQIENRWSRYSSAHYTNAEARKRDAAGAIGVNEHTKSVLDGLVAGAEDHLRGQGVHVAPRAAGVATSVTWSEVEKTIALAKSDYERLRSITLPPIWPRSVNGRWAVGFGSGVLLLFYPPLALVYPAVVLTVRWLRAARLEGLNESVNSHVALAWTGVRSHADHVAASTRRAEEEATQRFESARREYLAELEAARLAAAARVSAAQARHASAVAFAKQKHEAGTGAARSELARLLASARREIADFTESVGFATTAWDAEVWRGWSPDQSPGFAAQIGSLVVNDDDLSRSLPEVRSEVVVPALIPLAEGQALVLRASGSEKDPAVRAMQSVMTRLLATTPAGRLRFTFVDPVGLGQNVAPFVSLGDHSDTFISGKPWTEPHHIDRQLQDLSEHIQTVIQKYLRDDHATIHEYNRAAGRIAEAFRFLVVFDFPTNFTEASARRLLSVMQKGPRCGVYTLIHFDPSLPAPYGFAVDELLRSSAVIAWDRGGSGPRWIDEVFGECGLIADTLPDKGVLKLITDRAGRTSREAMRVEVPFEELLGIAGLESEHWRLSSRDGLRAPLGPSGARKAQFLEFGEGVAHHALVVGRTGSGKTNLMHVLIVSLALSYSPDELEMYLVDFKGGVGFKPFAQHRLPHAKVVAIESDREFGVSVLHGLEAEMKRRASAFRSAGAGDFAAFRSKVGPLQRMPRILLLVDEFHEFFTTTDRVADAAKVMLERLVKQGRGFGIHVMLGSQSLASSGLAGIRSMVDQMAVRVALQCSVTDAEAIMSRDNLAAKSLTRPGEAIYNSAAGAVEANSPFQVAAMTEAALNRYLNQVATLASSNGMASVPVVFEGSEPARIEECAPLRACGETQRASKFPTVWLGEPIELEPSVGIRIRAQSGRNLLIVAREEPEGMGLLLASWLSLMSQFLPGDAQFVLCDGTEVGEPSHPLVEEVCRAFSAWETELLERHMIADSLKGLSSEVARRAAHGRGSSKSVFLLIAGMQRFQALRTQDALARFAEAPSPGQDLSRVLREGPEVGIHTISWCDSFQAARRGLGDGLREFGARVGCAMPADDSRALLDTAKASEFTRSHRAILRDDLSPTQFTVFRPFGLPESSWIQHFAERLRKG